MISLELIYVLMGAMLLGVALVNAQDRRYTNAVFWGLYALTFLVGSYLPNAVSGVLVVGMVVVASRLAKAPPRARPPPPERKALDAGATSSSCPRSRFPCLPCSARSVSSQSLFTASHWSMRAK